MVLSDGSETQGPIEDGAIMRVWRWKSQRLGGSARARLRIIEEPAPWTTVQECSDAVRLRPSGGWPHAGSYAVLPPEPVDFVGVAPNNHEHAEINGV
jgi:hypothetical protein